MARIRHSFTISNSTSFLARTVVLVGMMGCGKSSIGKRLAKQLSVEFHDTDQEIENSAGYKLTDICEMWGEEESNLTEYQVLEKLLAAPPHILATGDRTFLQEKARQLILGQGMSIWLKSELNILVDRVNLRKNRPQLFHGDVREILERMAEERYPLYNLAHVCVESNDQTHAKTIERIMEILRERGILQTTEKRSQF